MTQDGIDRMAKVFGATLISIMRLTGPNVDNAPLMARKALEKSGIGSTPTLTTLRDQIFLLSGDDE